MAVLVPLVSPWKKDQSRHLSRQVVPVARLFMSPEQGSKLVESDSPTCARPGLQTWSGLRPGPEPPASSGGPSLHAVGEASLCWTTVTARVSEHHGQAAVAHFWAEHITSSGPPLVRPEASGRVCGGDMCGGSSQLPYRLEASAWATAGRWALSPFTESGPDSCRFLGPPDKAPSTRQLKAQMCSPSPGGLKSEVHVSAWTVSSPWRADGRPLPVSSRDRPSVCVCVLSPLLEEH